MLIALLAILMGMTTNKFYKVGLKTKTTIAIYIFTMSSFMLRKYHMHTIMNCIFLETPVVIISTSVFVDILVYW